MTADRPTTEPRVTAMDVFEHYLFESGLDEPHTTRLMRFAEAIEAEAAQGAAPHHNHDGCNPYDESHVAGKAAPRAEGLPLDTRPCSVECCDAQRVRHVHEGTHEDHTGDGRWCIDCDVVIGQAGENVSREGAAPRAEGLDVEWPDWFEEAEYGPPWKPEGRIEGDDADGVWLANEDGDSLWLSSRDVAWLLNHALSSHNREAAS